MYRILHQKEYKPNVERKHRQLILVGRKFFLGRAGTGKEVDGKLFIISGEVERNISKHGCSFYADVFLCYLSIGE